MSTSNDPTWLYRSEAFAEDLEPTKPAVVVPGPQTTWRRTGRSTAMLMLPALVALASTAAAVVAKPS